MYIKNYNLGWSPECGSYRLILWEQYLRNSILEYCSTAKKKLEGISHHGKGEYDDEEGHLLQHVRIRCPSIPLSVVKTLMEQESSAIPHVIGYSKTSAPEILRRSV